MDDPQALPGREDHQQDQDHRQQLQEGAAQLRGRREPAQLPRRRQVRRHAAGAQRGPLEPQRQGDIQRGHRVIV